MWPLYYKIMRKKTNPSFAHQTQLLYHEVSYVRLLSIIQVQILVGDQNLPHVWPYVSAVCIDLSAAI